MEDSGVEDSSDETLLLSGNILPLSCNNSDSFNAPHELLPPLLGADISDVYGNILTDDGGGGGGDGSGS